MPKRPVRIVYRCWRRLDAYCLIRPLLRRRDKRWFAPGMGWRQGGAGK